MDIIVDQAYSYSYGMSAAYALAKGKIVLSGMESEARANGIYCDCPVINIRPNVQDIADKIASVIESRSKLGILSDASRDFAERFHDHKEVARQYAEIYHRPKQ
ncbi:hypothetical protein WQ56_08020 [Luteimonas sp. FCS-9]|nr:hypothetical protein WQ56_08020 [Luteimonas sp. FCS-9]